MAKMNYDLAGKVIGLAMKVHSKPGPGDLESDYRNPVAYELRKKKFRQSRSLNKV